MSVSREEEIVKFMNMYKVTRDGAMFLQKFFYLELEETPENVKKLAEVLGTSERNAGLRFKLQLGIIDSIY